MKSKKIAAAVAALLTVTAFAAVGVGLSGKGRTVNGGRKSAAETSAATAYNDESDIPNGDTIVESAAEGYDGGSLPVTDSAGSDGVDTPSVTDTVPDISDSRSDDDSHRSDSDSRQQDTPNADSSSSGDSSSRGKAADSSSLPCDSPAPMPSDSEAEPVFPDDSDSSEASDSPKGGEENKNDSGIELPILPSE